MLQKRGEKCKEKRENGEKMTKDEKRNEKKRKKSKKEGIKIKGTKTIRRIKEGRWKKETKRCRGEKRDAVRGFDFLERK